MAVRQDFVLRMIERLIQLLAEIMFNREHGRHEVAMHLVLHGLHHQLGLDLKELAGMSPDEIEERLRRSETPLVGRDKCLAFAALNRQVGLIYLERGDAVLARRALELALEFTRRGRRDESAGELPVFAPDPTEVAACLGRCGATGVVGQQ